jgi:hypothetical protein
LCYTRRLVEKVDGSNLALGDTVRRRKPHPCGSQEWRVVRIGADIGLLCRGCGRRVLLPRAELAKRLKSVVAQPADAPGASIR